MKNILLVASLALSIAVAQAKEQCFGNFKTLQHDVQGKVCAKDAKTLVIYNFSYDGKGPDAFFWVGKSGVPKATDEQSTYILGENGDNYEYGNENAPKLGEYSDETVVLTLPEGWQMSDIKWISVWCRKFSVNFGELVVPDGFQISDDEDIPHPGAPEPEPEHTDDHDHDDHDHHDHWDHDGHDHHEIDNSVDAEPEAEPSSKAEPEPEPHGAAAGLTLVPAAVLAALAAIIV